VGLLAAKTVEVTRVCLNSDASKGSEVWNDLLFVLNQADIQGKLTFQTSLVRDDTGSFDQGAVHIQIVGPGKYLAGRGVNNTDRFKRRIHSNSLSAVIRLLQDDKPIALFPGDLDEIGIDDMIADGAVATAPLVVFPHHGGAPGTPDLESFVCKLCRLVAPSVIIFSVARGRPKHPLPAIFELLRKNLKEFRIACTQLSEHCANVTPAINPVHLTNFYAQGRENRKCCAGTLVIELDHPDVLFPINPAHQAFIDVHAPTALCRHD
jgi:competence protein ComEC